jgi:nucleotide-binding universal stress UspA family protein
MPVSGWWLGLSGSDLTLSEKEYAMYQKILVAYNDAPESRSALHACLRLAPGPSAEIHLVGVINVGTYLMAGEHVCEAVLAAEKYKIDNELAASHALLADAGLNVIDHLQVGEPVNIISELVEKLGIELVIVGHSRNKPLAMRWWRGSADAMLVEKIRCNVLVAADLA